MASTTSTKVNMDVFSSSNTLKSHTNTHTIRGIATLKDVERFRKGHLTRYREIIVAIGVKLIVNYLNYLSKLPILSKANSILTNSTGSETTKDSTNECHQSNINDKNMEITSTLSEGHYNKLPTTVYSDSKPCDSQSKLTAALSKMIPSSMFMLSILLLLLFFVKSNVSCFTVFIFLILSVIGYKSVKLFGEFNQNVVSSLLTDCDILEKANNLTVHANANLCIDAEITIKVTSNTRSRYSRFVYYNYYMHIRRSHRAREPSRIPTRILSRLKSKNRKLRWVIYHQIRSNIPRSSKLYYYINRLPLKVINKDFLTKFKGISSTSAFCIYQTRLLNYYKCSRYTSLFTCNKPMSFYKSKSHVTSYCESQLYNDIEKNPGPNGTPYNIDPTKTIAAPYSQGNAFIFGQNADEMGTRLDKKEP